MNKRLVIMTGVAVAAIVGFLALRNGYPPKSGTEGAIGAAKRYQSQQIGAQDVSLEDADIQAFLQTDVFHKMTTNPDFKKLVTSGDFQKVAAAPEFSKITSAPEYQKLIIASPEFSKMVSTPEFGKIVAAPEYQKLIAAPEFSKVTSSPEFQKMTMVPEFNKLIAAPELSKIVAAPEFAKVAVMPEFHKLVTQVDAQFRHVVGCTHEVALVEQPGVEPDDVVPCRTQSGHHLCPDVSEMTGNQNFHGKLRVGCTGFTAPSVLE